MTCPYYTGEGFNWEGRGFVICSANPGSKRVLRDSQGMKRNYCLGKYPQCPYFEKSKEVGQ